MKRKEVVEESIRRIEKIEEGFKDCKYIMNIEDYEVVYRIEVSLVFLDFRKKPIFIGLVFIIFFTCS